MLLDHVACANILHNQRCDGVHCNNQVHFQSVHLMDRSTLVYIHVGTSGFKASLVLSLSCDVCNVPATGHFMRQNIRFSLPNKPPQRPCNVANPIPSQTSQILPQNDPGPQCVSGPSHVLANLKKSLRPLPRVQSGKAA